MNINKTRIANLKRIIFEDYNNSIHQFATRIGRHSSQFYNLFSGDRSFGQKLARDLEILLNLTPLTLDKSSDEETIIDKIAVIPEYNINTRINSDSAEIANNIFVIEKSVIEYHGWPMSNLQGLIVNDESMSPTIPPGGKVLVDTSQVKINDGNIYALSKDNEIFIQRVFHLENNIKYEAKPDNIEYEPIQFKLNHDINIVGRVLCVLNKIL